MRSSTSARSTPRSSATMLEPSLTTARPMAPERLTGVQFEHDARNLHVVARFEPRRLERTDHAHAPQPALDVQQGVLVVQVVAGDQPVDGLAGHAEQSVLDALDAEATACGRLEHAVLRELGHVR